MIRRIFFFGLLGAFLGLIFGASLGLFGPPLFWQFTNPEIFRDGQWALYFFKTVPYFAKWGIFVGGFIGGMRALRIAK